MDVDAQDVLGSLNVWGEVGLRPCLSIYANGRWHLRMNVGAGGKARYWMGDTPNEVVGDAILAEERGEFAYPRTFDVDGDERHE